MGEAQSGSHSESPVAARSDLKFDPISGAGAHTCNVVFLVCALILLSAAAVYAMFADREITFDEAGLYNPVYMFQHYGKMTYPAHGSFFAMIIHPPAHYYAVALLMGCGLSLFHAAGLIPVLLFAILLFVLYRSRISIAPKFGLMLGTFCGIFVWTPAHTMRPEFSLAVAWMGGLIALESGRLAEWDWRYLFGGAALVAYASVVHYPAYFSIFGVAVYVIWAWLVLPRDKARKRIIVLCAGVAIVWLPYLMFNVYPNRHAILQLLRSAESGWTLFAALRRHRECYRAWSDAYQFFAQQPFVRDLLTPILQLRIPAVFLGAPLLLFFPTSRGVALASLPHLLFMVFGAQHKQIGIPGYFAPEFAIYLAGVVSLILDLAMRAWRLLRIAPIGALGAWVAIAAVMGLSLHDRPVFENRSKLVSDLDELELARAVSRKLLGPNAFVGSTSVVVWFTSGAQHFYLVSPDLLWTPSIANLDRRAYFSQFDALVTDPFQTWLTQNRERENITSSYLEGILHLRSFYVADRRAGSDSELSLMYYSVRPPTQLSGFAVRERRVYRFDEDRAGNYVFFCATCPISDLKNNGQFDFFSTSYFPLKTDSPPWSRADCGEQTPVIRTLLVPRSTFEQDVLPAARRCIPRTVVSGRLEQVDRNALLSELRTQDLPIRFHRNIDDAFVATGRLSPPNTVRVPGALSLDTIALGYPAARVERRSDGVKVTTIAQQWSYAAAAQLRAWEKGLPRGYVYVRAKILKGAIGVALLNTKTNTIASEYFWDIRDGVGEIYIRATSFSDVDEIMFRNIADGGASEILIQDLAVVTDKDEAGSGRAASARSADEKVKVRDGCSVPAFRE